MTTANHAYHQTGRTAGLVAGAVLGLLAVTPAKAGDWMGELQLGTGYGSGDAAYSIGGKTWAPDTGTEQLPDKISELTFPLDAPYGSLGGSARWRERLEIRGVVTANLADPSAKTVDQDWDESGALMISSETDTELTAVATDVGVLYWFHPATPATRSAWSVGAGPGLLYQHADWTLSNLDQWYPGREWAGHDHEFGKAATYRAEVLMPCMDVGAVVRSGPVSGRLELGVGPAFVHDEDHHILRAMKSTADLTGVGIRGSAEVRYDFTAQVFALARVTALSIGADGTDTTTVYAGEDAGDTWEIEQHFSLESVQYGVAVGWAF